MKPHLWRRSWAGKYLRHVPRLKQLRGTFIHRTFGDRLLDPRLWQWDRQSTALGLALGAFFSAIPTVGQTVPAVAVAVVLRANIPAALVGCWFSNPLTFVPFFYLQLKIGSFLLGKPSLIEALNEHSFMTILKTAPAVLFLGGAVLGVVLAVVTYVASLLVHDTVMRAIQRSSRRPLLPEPAGERAAKPQSRQPAGRQ